MFLFIESILLFDAVHWSQFDEDMSQFHCSHGNFLGQKLPNGYLDLAKLWDMASPSLTSKKWWKIHYKHKQESHERKGLQKIVKPMAKDWSNQTTIGNLDLFNMFDIGIIVMTVPEKVCFPDLSIHDLRIGDISTVNPLTYQPLNPPRPGHCRELGPSEASM